MKFIGQIEDFLIQQKISEKSVLLALSGGPDSLALLHILLHLRQKVPFQLAIAHVDHGWRIESTRESQILEEMALGLKLPFHLKSLNPQTLKGNLEAACRRERLTFFKELCDQYGYDAVLLGHQRDDQAETVIKKIFEGAALPNLGGMPKVARIEGVTLWRPMLDVDKSCILAWLNSQGIVPFYDKTNDDPKFLRTRMRKEIIPGLSEDFGKDIHAPLLRISIEAQELKDFLQTFTCPILEKIVDGPKGALLDLSRENLDSPFLQRHVIKQFCERQGVILTHPLVDTLRALFVAGAANRMLQKDDKLILIDRKRIAILQKPWPESDQTQLIEPGCFRIGEWEVFVDLMPDSFAIRTGWPEAWKGDLIISLPAGEYRLGFANPRAPCIWGGTLDKWWTNHKVPAYLRRRVPVIWKDGQVVHEFLTGKNYKPNSQCSMRVKLAL